jgi:transcription-repair coupling factor (superfamily II helicase)
VIETIRRKIAESEPFGQLTAAVESLRFENPVQVQGISGSLMAFVAAHLFTVRQSQMLLIVPDKDHAEQLRDDCALLLGESPVRIFASSPTHAAKLLDMSAPIAQMETLCALSRSERVLIIASAEALTMKLPPLKRFTERSIELEINKEYPFEHLIQKLTGLGFEKKDFVEEYGDFAVRGGILDIFPFVGDNPIRFEFWGDSIESIREFDVLSQRSIRELQTASVVASLYSIHPDGDISSQKTDITENIDKQVSLFEYLIGDALLFLDEPLLIEKEFDELVQEGYTDIFEWKMIETQLKGFPRILHTTISNIQSPSSLSFHAHPQPPLGGSVRRLIEQVQKLSDQDNTVYLACDTKEEGERLSELIEEELTAPDESGIIPQTARDAEEYGDQKSPARRLGREAEKQELENIDQTVWDTEKHESRDEDDIHQIVHFPLPIQYQLLTEALHFGFIYPSAKIAIFTEHEIFGRLKRRGTIKRKKFKGFTQKELQQLMRADFVVHQDYGIGRFAGLQKIKVRGIETEVMKLVYEENDTLYVHLNFINRVQKYSSQEGHTPKLNKLGGADWDRLKSKARKKIKDIARDLIKLYARRKHEMGFSFAPDTHWQKEMEASFLYEDTPDQAKSTLDVKQDMEQISPMDRLICGDVGFGKTEVAVRAAFKAVMNGKQVAVLVPTTILAHQHFKTFLDRVGRYSVRVESLTRFRAKKEQADVLQGLQEGTVDILIGTHRLLSKDVMFKDLGLLIIDEEQIGRAHV